MLKKVKIIGIVVLVICIGYGIFKIYNINTKYMSPQLLEYSQNEEIKAESIALNIKNSSLLGATQVQNDYPLYKELLEKQQKDITDENALVLMVDISVKNNSDEHKRTTLTQIMAESGAWTNGFDMDLYFIVNDINQVYINLKEYEEKTFKVPFIMYKSQFKQKAWEKVKNRDFHIVLSTYPVKNIVRLEL